MTRHFFELSAFFFNRDHGVPLGRRVVSLKVAVSPGRDIMTLINAEGKRARKTKVEFYKIVVGTMNVSMNVTVVSDECYL